MVVILGSTPRALQNISFSYCCLFGAIWVFQVAPILFTTNVKLIKVDNYIHFQYTIHQ